MDVKYQILTLIRQYLISAIIWSIFVFYLGSMVPRQQILNISLIFGQVLVRLLVMHLQRCHVHIKT